MVMTQLNFRFLFLVFMALGAMSAAAQGSVKGRVLDQQGGGFDGGGFGGGDMD